MTETIKCATCGQPIDAGMTPEHPPLPTSREWVESDGERCTDNDVVCQEDSQGNGWGYECKRAFHQSSHHVAIGAIGRVLGRWYDGGPFVEAV